MSNPKLSTVLRMQGNVAPLEDGRIEVNGFELDIQDEAGMKGAFRRMVRAHEFEVSELALTTYVVAKEHGAQFTALPIFLVREFHHGAILFNRDAGIEHPKQLEGQRVGVDRGFTVTTGVWARSILADEFDVDLSKITWVLSSDEHVENFAPPANVEYIKPGRELRKDLDNGDLSSVIGFFPADIPAEYKNIVALYPDSLAAGLDALQSRGHYPINHLMVVRDDVLARHPDLPVALFDAFTASKNLYVDALRAGEIGDPTHIDDMHRQVLELGRDPLPYGIAPNRNLLEGYLESCLSQGVLKKRVSLEDLFEPSTLERVG